MIATIITDALLSMIGLAEICNVRQALEYARQAADAFRVAYAVWHVRKGTQRLLRRYPPAHVQVRA